MPMLPLLVAAAGVLATVVAHRTISDDAVDEAQTRFQLESEALVDSVMASVERYGELTTSVAETVELDGRRISQEEFSTYADSLILAAQYPAAFGIAWADAIPRARLAEFLADQEIPPAAFDDLNPGESRDMAVVVSYGEPDENMGIARGVEAQVFPEIEAVLNLSAAMGVPLISAPLTLPMRVGPGTEDAPTLVFMVDPVYRETGGAPGAPTVKGWAAVLFDMTNFARLATNSLGDRYALSIEDIGVDGTLPLASNSLEALEGGRGRAVERDVMGRRWRFIISEAQGVAYGDPQPSDVILIGGLAVTAVIFTVVALLTWSERRAQKKVRKATAELALRAATDELTGLANRAQLRIHINDLIRAQGGTSRSVAVLYLDLDRFKLVNDSLGHAAGDQLLREVAERLLSACSDDHVVARLGGDEFVVVVPACDLTEAEAIAHRVRSQLSLPFAVGSEELFVQASIGIALAHSAADADSVLQRADMAMYAAKGAEVGGVALFTPSLLQQAEERLAMASDLRRGLDQHQFFVVFQAINGLRGEGVVGYETLVRWNHPTRGVILPGEFLPTATETGVVNEIDAWVRSQALAKAAAWPEDLAVSINVSARELAAPRFAEEVLADLRRAGLRPERLVIEVTETDLAADPEEASQVLHGLRAAGVRVAVDDFGTGYSSLSILRMLPADVLKVDRALVSAASDTQEDRAVLRVIIELGHALGMRIVAEGVEDFQHLGILQEIGCDLAQGWLYGSESPDPFGPGGVSAPDGVEQAHSH